MMPNKIIVLLVASLLTNVNAFIFPRQRIRTTSTLYTNNINSRDSCIEIKTQLSNLNEMIGDVAAVSLGAVVGAVSRYQVGNIATRIIAEDKRLAAFTGWHTAAINVFGSFILGSLAGVPTIDPSTKNQELKGISPRMRLMAGVGFCGSFTTFSTFSVDIIGMLNSGKVGRAVAYCSVNNFGGIAAAFAGFNMAKRMIKS